MNHQRRYPIEPLFEAAGTSSRSELAAALGLAVRVVQRWCADGGVPEQSADRVALGWHPAALWPVEWADWMTQSARKVERRREARMAARDPTAA